MDHQQKAQALVERFLSYLAISSQSDPKNKVVPSSEGQWTMARVLEAGLKQMGLKEVEVDEHGNVTAYLPGSVKDVPTVGFVAHVDTVDVGLSPEIHHGRRRLSESSKRHLDSVGGAPGIIQSCRRRHHLYRWDQCFGG